MSNRKTQLAAAVGSALLVFGGGAQAQALEAKVSGQVNRAIMYADDGVQKKTFNVDNEISGTRFRFTGAATMMPGIRAGVHLEWDYQSNESQLVTIAVPSSPAATSATASQLLVERYADVWFEHASFGKLHLGQGDGAANGAVEVDLSGTGIINPSLVTDLGGALAFRVTGTGALSAATIGGVISQQDFESRYDRTMYVTPTFAGFRGQVSNGTKDTFNTSEAALWYSGKLGALGDLAGALGWSSQGAASGLNKDVTIGGSVSWLHTSGINLTYGHTEREVPLAPPAARDAKFDYVKLGYKFGRHAIAVDYAIGKDQAATGDEAKMYGVGYVFAPIGWAEIYAGYKLHSLDRPGTALEDIALFTVGTRLKF
jgi:hypothetical protein